MEPYRTPSTPAEDQPSFRTRLAAATDNHSFSRRILFVVTLVASPVIFYSIVPTMLAPVRSGNGALAAVAAIGFLLLGLASMASPIISLAYVHGENTNGKDEGVPWWAFAINFGVFTAPLLLLAVVCGLIYFSIRWIIYGRAS